MESWPEMGSATVHPTGATLALGDPSVSLNAMGGGGALELPSAGGSSNTWPEGGRLACSWVVVLTSIATVCGQDSGRQNAPLHHRGSIALAACPAA